MFCTQARPNPLETAGCHLPTLPANIVTSNIRLPRSLQLFLQSLVFELSLYKRQYCFINKNNRVLGASGLSNCGFRNNSQIFVYCIVAMNKYFVIKYIIKL